MSNTPTLLPAIPVRNHSDSTLNFDNLRRRLQPPWKLLSSLIYEHGWVDYEPTRKGEYRKRLGVVELRGIVKGGVNAESIVILPTGYRPASERSWVVLAGGVAPAYIAVNPSGTITAVNLAAPSNVNAFVYLDPVSFSVE